MANDFFPLAYLSKVAAELGTDYWAPVLDLALPPSGGAALLWLALIFAGELQ